MHLNWMAKIWFKGAQSTWSSILILVCCTRILLYTRKCKKKLKKHTALLLLFLSLVAFQLGGGGTIAPPPPPPPPRDWLRLWKGSKFIKFCHGKFHSSITCKTFIGFRSGVFFRWNVSLWNIFCRFFKKKFPIEWYLKNGCKINF